jgi:hypothetical protein
MNLVERNQMIQEFQQVQMEILKRKGNDYAAGDEEDSGNANFEIVASLLVDAPMDELTVWAVYFLKHVCSIITFIRKRHLESEPIADRFHDIANYANIGHTLVEEMKDRNDDEMFNSRNIPVEREDF